MKNKNKRFGGSEIGKEVVPFKVTATANPRYTYNIFLQGAIEAPEDFIEALSVLAEATEDDFVNIYLSSPGGSVDAANTLIFSMMKCRCPVHVIGSGTICSMGTFILLAADSFELCPLSCIMFHQFSYGNSGPTVDMEKFSRFTKKQMRKQFEMHFTGFFTEDEINGILERKDEVWMDTEEFVERYYKMMEVREQECSCGANCQGFCEDLSDEEELSSEQLPVKPKKKTIH